MQWLKTPLINYIIVSVGHESRHGIAGFCTSETPEVTVKVLAGAEVSSEG